MPPTQVILVDRRAELRSALATLDDLDPVGVDVERADWNRYYRAAALIQLGGDGRVVLVDPLGIDDLSALDAFLAERTTLLHALENDLGPLESLGVHPRRVEDTAIAAALLGLPMGLETLLADLLGVELAGDKAAMQRANWEERPLSDEMLEYAAGDVADLPALWALLADRLRGAGRWEWYAEEVRARIEQPSVEDRRDWQRTKGVGRLDARARARARVLWETREDLARRTDTAPGRIIGDKVLVDLALHPPTTTRELGRRGVRRQAVRDFGDAIVAALDRGGTVAPEPVERRSRRVTDEDRDLAERLRVVRAEVAESVGLDPGLLCPSRHLLGAVLADPTTPEELRDALGLRNWQWALLEERFTATVLGREDAGERVSEEAAG